MKLYRTPDGAVVEHDGGFRLLPHFDWDGWVNQPDLAGVLSREIERLPRKTADPLRGQLLPPIGRQEVWAAGVTYLRSRAARVEESKAAGGGTFYDRVYEAVRPELFFKSTAARVVGHQGEIRIRADSMWTVPEAELALVLDAAGSVVGYTIGNDVSSRDIEGENPLYLPQAKVYDGACALGPGVLLSREPLPPPTAIEIDVVRQDEVVFHGRTTLSEMKRSVEELVEHLYRETSFPDGCILLTGTGIVPDDSFALVGGDIVRIMIPPIGTLENQVSRS